MIRKKRLEKRLTQKKLARQLGVSQGYVSRLENKKVNNLNKKLIYKLSNILFINFKDLINWIIE